MSDTSLKAQRRRAAKPMLWIGMASMAMAFAGLTSGYVVGRASLLGSGKWIQFDVPAEFIASTAVILISSLVMVYTVRQARKQNRNGMITGLVITLILGLAFACLQILGWGRLTDQGIYFTGAESTSSGSWFYAITWFHLMHMASGIIALLVTTIKASVGKYSKGDILGVEMAAIFWHFLDILWIYLFLFLSFIR